MLRTYVHAAVPKTYRPIPPHNRLPLATLMSTKLSRPLWAILRVSAPCRAPHGLAQSRRPSLWLSAGQAKIQAPPASRPLWPSGPGKAMPQHPAAIHQSEAALGPPQSRSQHQARARHCASPPRPTGELRYDANPSSSSSPWLKALPCPRTEAQPVATAPPPGPTHVSQNKQKPHNPCSLTYAHTQTHKQASAPCTYVLHTRTKAAPKRVESKREACMLGGVGGKCKLEGAPKQQSWCARTAGF